MPSRQPRQSNPTQSLTSSKSRFMTRQLALLSSPLILPVSSTTTSTSSSPSLPPTTLTPLLSKINKKITSHNRLHFSLQSQRHVIEQIESLYWRDVLEGGLPVRKGETIVRREEDLTLTAKGAGAGAGEVGSLPDEWEDVIVGVNGSGGGGWEGEDGQEQRERYTKLREALSGRVTQRDHLRKKVSALRRLKRQLEPFEDPKENVQSNLVGTSGNKEVEGEIARMRVLLVRAEGVVRERQKERVRSDGEDDSGMQEGEEEVQQQRQQKREMQVQKLEEVLGMT